MTARDLEEQLDLAARLRAIIAEAKRGDPEECVVPIAEGALEELDALLAGEEPAS